MGQQIATAEFVEDEVALHLYVGQNHDLLAIPRCPTTSSPTPHLLGLLPDAEQILFPAECAAWILANLTPGIPGPSGRPFFVLSPSGLACIQWHRSVVREDGVVPGRYYLSTSLSPLPGSAPPPAHQALITRLMRRLTSYVRRSYPLRSATRYPTYVGPHLAAAVLNERSVVRFAGGSPMPLVPNTPGAT